MARRRSTRALNNDAAIRAAAVDQILKVGVDSVALRDIAKAAKLSHGAIYARFEDVEELLVDLWSESLVERAVTLFDTVSRAVNRPSKRAAAAIMDRLRLPTPDDVAMVKVLWTSRRYVIVHEEVESFIHDYLDTVSTEMSEPLQSRAVTLFSFVLLALFASSQDTLQKQDFDCFEATILEALQCPVDEVNEVTMNEPIIRAAAPPRDDLKGQLAYHTYLAVGKSGYSRATISRISRRADCSPGAIYKIYSSKEDLIIGSVNANVTPPWFRIATLAAILEPGYLAQLLYTAASPDNQVRRDFTLEVMLASTYNLKLRGAVHHRLRDVESIVPMIDGLSEQETIQFTCMIRFIIYTLLGVSYLSTVTKTTDHVDFNQFAEPLRRAILKTMVPSWSHIQRQLQNIASTSKDAAQPSP